jgi:predicted MFS family arabinose efflux permease
MAPGPAPTAPADGGVTSGQVMRNRNIWFLAAAFAALNAAVIGLGTYMPTSLVSQHGMALGTAALVASITTLITIFSAPGGGILSDRIGLRKKPYLVGFAAGIILLPLTGVLNVTGLIILMVVNGLVIGVIPTKIFSAAVEAAGDERQGGAAMAVIKDHALFGFGKALKRKLAPHKPARSLQKRADRRGPFAGQLHLLKPQHAPPRDHASGSGISRDDGSRSLTSVS